MTTPSSTDPEDVTSFVEAVCGPSSLRIEEDLGAGYVRLRSSEAERRQALQDIRTVEDAVIELLRNARDAGAKHIFLASQKNDQTRTVLMIDDGSGIPTGMHEKIFQPRVTSKLDSSVMDRWGIHGRGMALYSIAMNAKAAEVCASDVGLGAALAVTADLHELREKTDQSTFPRFEQIDEAFAMRGPRNILRTAAEFAFEHREDLSVYCGSPAEIAAVLYEYGRTTTTPSQRAFRQDIHDVELVKRLGYALDPAEFAAIASSLGLDLSERTCRRIMESTSPLIPSLMERIAAESFPSGSSRARSKGGQRSLARSKRSGRTRLDREDLDDLAAEISRSYATLAEKYYLDGTIEPVVRQSRDALIVEIPLIDL